MVSPEHFSRNCSYLLGSSNGGAEYFCAENTVATFAGRQGFSALFSASQYGGLSLDNLKKKMALAGI
jgi:hypothetical protein